MDIWTLQKTEQVAQSITYTLVEYQKQQTQWLFQTDSEEKAEMRSSN